MNIFSKVASAAIGIAALTAAIGATVYTTIEGQGNTKLVKDQNGYIYAQSGSAPPIPIMGMGGATQHKEQDGDYQAVAAEEFSVGNRQVLWKKVRGSGSLGWVWQNAHNSGNWVYSQTYASHMPGSAGFFSMESYFGVDVDGDGLVGSLPTASAGEIQVRPGVSRSSDPAQVVTRIVVDDSENTYMGAYAGIYTSTYTIPFIQSGSDIKVTADASIPGVYQVVLQLYGPNFSASKTVPAAAPNAVFTGLPPGEFQLDVEWKDNFGTRIAKTSYTKIGVGRVLAALGDSLTEGYFGLGFNQESLYLKASDFPVSAVSKDGRNFPQVAPTAVKAIQSLYPTFPMVNTFQSWMTSLNNGLAASWKMPVFIANEGWGGFTSAEYLAAIRSNAGWQSRMRILKPTVWLIHLGVNDAGRGVTKEVFAQNMDAIITYLKTTYGAKPTQIYLAYPSYDYRPGAAPILGSYIDEINKLISAGKARKGADFFTAFQPIGGVSTTLYYPGDYVHPNVNGVERMSQLWLQVLSASLPP
jgi:lysophospholipase L1-like esterase